MHTYIRARACAHIHIPQTSCCENSPTSVSACARVLLQGWKNEKAICWPTACYVYMYAYMCVSGSYRAGGVDFPRLGSAVECWLNVTRERMTNFALTRRSAQKLLL